MVLLKKEQSVFQRDEKGELIPQTLVLETLEDKPEIEATLLTRGELMRIHKEAKSGNTTEEQDSKLIVEHCKNPSYTEEEAKYLKPNVAGAIVTALLSASMDISQTELQDMGRKQALNEELLKKKAE
jgi:hypothetical protein